MDTLIFVDTNILLDFYRYPRGSAVLSVLKHIEDNHSKIITGNQIEMEFKKNRQKVITESIKEMKGPKWETFKVPVILADSKPAQAIETSKKEIERQSGNLQKRIEAVLRYPARYDVVYKTLQRLFRNDSALNLTRKDDTRFFIRRLARKRFVLGYPPRKDSDITIGDAINWEWLVYCASERNANVVIVSRDADYGCKCGHEPIINDWLLEEFKERVNRRRKAILTDKLTQAFKLAKVTVRKEEEKDEEELIEISNRRRVTQLSIDDLMKEVEKGIEQELLHHKKSEDGC